MMCDETWVPLKKGGDGLNASLAKTLPGVAGMLVDLLLFP